MQINARRRAADKLVASIRASRDALIEFPPDIGATCPANRRVATEKRPRDYACGELPRLSTSPPRFARSADSARKIDKRLAANRLLARALASPIKSAGRNRRDANSARSGPIERKYPTFPGLCGNRGAGVADTCSFSLLQQRPLGFATSGYSQRSPVNVNVCQLALRAVGFRHSRELHCRYCGQSRQEIPREAKREEHSWTLPSIIEIPGRLKRLKRRAPIRASIIGYRARVSKGRRLIL